MDIRCHVALKVLLVCTRCRMVLDDQMESLMDHLPTFSCGKGSTNAGNVFSAESPGKRDS